MADDIFARTEALVGSEALSRMAGTRVLLFGVGGVGSWCAEALIRSGIGHLTIVDPDCVDATNINRQLPATTLTVGQPKVEVMRRRLLEINPTANIIARKERFTADTAATFHLEEYDYVIDCIDSIADKMELILVCSGECVVGSNEDRMLHTAHCQLPTFFSAMGAACKMDPTQVRVSEFWKIDGCPLAAKLRKRMRRAQRFPERKFKCVWSPEVIRGTTQGSMVHVTATVGMTLAGLVLRDIH